MSNYFVEKGNDVSIVISVKKATYYKLNDKVKLYGLDKENAKRNFILRNISRINRLNSIINQTQPDIIISFLPEPSYRVLFLKLIHKKLNIIVSVRNDPKTEYSNWIKKTIMKFLYGKANGFIFQTQEAKEFFSPKIQKISVVIPNPISEEFMVKPYLGERKKTIVTVGRLEEQKNHKLLIDSFCAIENKYPEYKLLIYGSGSKENEIKKYIEEIKLKNKIELKGNVNDIKNEIYTSGLFILSSNFEGMPNALMEAMALGLPVISTDCPCGGPKFLIRNFENGILVPINNKTKMVEAIEFLLDNEKKSKKMGIEANKISEKLNPNNIYMMWENYVLKILNKKESVK